MIELLYKDISLAINILINLLRVLEAANERVYDFCDKYYDTIEFKRLADTVLKGIAAQATRNSKVSSRGMLQINTQTLPAIALSGTMAQHPRTLDFTLKSQYSIHDPDGIRLLYTINCNHISRELAVFLAHDYLADIMRTYFNVPQTAAIDVEGYPTDRYFVTNGMLALVQDRLIYCMIRWTNSVHCARQRYSVDQIPKEEHLAIHDICAQALYHLQRLHNMSHYLSMYPTDASAEMIRYLMIKNKELEQYEMTHFLLDEEYDKFHIGSFSLLTTRIIDDRELMQELKRSFAQLQGAQGKPRYKSAR